MARNNLHSVESPCDLVRQTAAWICSQASHVVIDQKAANELITRPVFSDFYTLPTWDSGMHLSLQDAEPDLLAQYVITVSALNFCFWPFENGFEYENLSRGIRFSVLTDSKCISAESLEEMDEQGLQKLLHWHPIPHATERVRLLREIGQGLAASFNGQAKELIEAAKGSASELIRLVTVHFPGFRDHAIYKGRQVFFYKRAQIFVADIYGAFQGQSLGKFTDLDQLTMFADYRVPVVLRELGVLQYSPALENIVDSQIEIAPGSEYEIEIRAASIMAVELMKGLVKKAMGMDKPPYAVHIDWFLWNVGEAQRAVHKPHHRTLTIYY